MKKVRVIFIKNSIVSGVTYLEGSTHSFLENIVFKLETLQAAQRVNRKEATDNATTQ